jgi:hypothetical protein
MDFGSDIDVRRRWFVEVSFAHPAKLHLGLLQFIIDRYTRPGDVIADPMGGTGSLLFAALMQRDVIVRDVEPRWVAVAEANAMYLRERGGLFLGHMDIGQQDARLPWGYEVNHVICSPPYGNEASSSPFAHRALVYRQLPGRRWQSLLVRMEQQAGTYGSVLFHYGTHPDQIGHYRGHRYLDAMRAIYTQAHAAIHPDGQLILILKDHIRDGKRVPTVDLTIALCQEIGFVLMDRFQRHLAQLSLWQRRRKEQGLPVVEEEDVLVFARAESFTAQRKERKRLL